ncbi:MAG: M1 family aminopeptidase, partial [Gammaproteobacteria bacterium]|nr:M1 family aminopeptidase [Gammaproteobacteria bacterium]
MFRKLIVFFSFVLTTLAVNAEETIHHEFIVELMPATHKINVMDTIHFSKQQMQQVQKDGASFILHAGEQPVLQTGNLKLEEVAMSGDELSQYSVPVKKYKVSGQFAKPLFTVKYEREIAHNLNEIKQGTAETPGLIDDIGVYLAGESAWYPRFNNELVTFTLSVKLPVKWSSVSQGARIYQENEAQYHLDTWQEKSPQDDIYLVAYSFAENSMRVGDVEVMTFLRTPDEALSQRYLGISSQYISMYETLLGKFPYSKFALVENFWESGYGMPSFTLLGESVVRLPFIIYTSYPHELLHNYWGNSVYVDYSQGNWSEGLTTYLADYLLKEQRGQGANYRRGVLQKYTNFTQNGGDFALDKFIARKDQASEAIGYGKTMMLFHMLRRSLGDKKFIEGLRKLYADYQFKFAAFSDIEKIYSELSHTDMHDFFSQWIERVGAP